jgi:hypothetical protein
MTYLSRLTKVGFIKEATPYTWLAPGFSLPWNTAKFTDSIIPLRDESMRANDSVLQGLNQGPWTVNWEFEANGYADLAGHLFRGIIGPDTVTAGVSTVLNANTAANATSITLTATVPNNSILQISDASGANLEWVQVGTVTGTGPYTAPITIGAGAGGNSTRFAHTAAGGSVLSQSTHTFTQNRSFATVWPTYSFTTDDGQDQLGWPGNVMSELGLKIDPKGFITFAPKYTGFPSVTEATFSYAASAVQPIVGWGWTVTNGGASSTRGLTMDITLKRAVEAIQSGDGTQAPREIFPGAMEIDGSYKAVYDSAVDMALFKQYTQSPTVHTLTQPITSGGQSIAITMSKSGYTTGEVDTSTLYVSLAQAVSGIANSTDSGVSQVVLKNYLTSAF